MANAVTDQRQMSEQEAATMLGISRRKVRLEIINHTLKAKYIKGRWVISKTEVQRYQTYGGLHFRRRRGPIMRRYTAWQDAGDVAEARRRETDPIDGIRLPWAQVKAELGL